MIKIKKILKHVCYIIAIIILIFIYKTYEKNIINEQNSFDFFMINAALNNQDYKTIKYKIKNLDNKKIHSLIKYNKLNVESDKIKSNLTKKKINNRKVKKKLNIYSSK